MGGWRGPRPAAVLPVRRGRERPPRARGDTGVHREPARRLGVGRGARHEPAGLRPALLPPGRREARVPRARARAGGQPPERPPHLRRRVAAGGRGRHRGGGELPRPLVQLPAPPPRPGRDLPLPVHGAPGLRPRGAGRPRPQGAEPRHHQDPRRRVPRPGLRPRLRHVLPVGRAAPPAGPVHRLHVHPGPRMGPRSRPDRAGSRPERPHEQPPPHHRGSRGRVPEGPIRRARRRGAPADRRRVRDLRPRQRRGARPGAGRAGRARAAVLPAQERAGHGPHRHRVRQGAPRPGDLCLHDLGRAGRHEHADGRGHRHGQPAARAAPPGRRLREPRPQPGAPAARVPRTAWTSA